MNEQQIQAIIFDFDGTLAEVNLDFVEMKRRVASLAACFLEHRPEPNSLPALEWIDVLASEIGRGQSALGLEFASRGRLLITAMEMDAAKTGRLFPFTQDLLMDLRKSGIKTAIITRNCTAAVKKVFPPIESLCDVFLARDAVDRVKPDPEHVLSALAGLDVPSRRAMVVGDHPLDIETARRSKTFSGAVASGRVSLEELAGHHPDFLAADCSTLVKQLIKAGILMAVQD